MAVELGLERPDQDHLMTPGAFHTLVATRVSEVIADPESGEDGNIQRISGYNPFDTGRVDQRKYIVIIDPNHPVASFVRNVLRIEQDLSRGHPFPIPWGEIPEAVKRDNERIERETEIFSLRYEDLVTEALRGFLS